MSDSGAVNHAVWIACYHVPAIRSTVWDAVWNDVRAAVPYAVPDDVWDAVWNAAEPAREQMCDV